MQVAQIVKSPQIKEVVSKTEQLQQQVSELQKETEQLATKLANQQAGDVFKDVERNQWYNSDYSTSQC